MPTSTGAVRGLVVDGVHAFLGIPYAAPPVGPRWLAPPMPPEPSDGVRDATAFGASAPQPVSTFLLTPQDLVPGDEYLNLNIYTPDPGAAGLPVLFSVHGGGYVFGSNVSPTSGTARLAARGMVLVSINYRLGYEGFLPVRGATPNRGVLDWLAALEWVQENIAAFGGDPGRVTICGYSSGSAACCVLLGLPQAAGSFAQVVAMSGTAWNQLTLAEADAMAADALADLGVDRSVDGLASVPYARLLEHQDRVAPILTPVTDPLATFAAVASGPGLPGPRPGRGWLGPCVDGEIVPRHTGGAIEAGAGGARPLLVGCTVNEMDSLVGLFVDTVTADAAVAAVGALGLDAGAVDAWFSAEADRSPAASLGAALTALTFRLPALRVAEANTAAGGTSHVYHFTWRPPTPLGAVHCIDLPFAFDTLADAAGLDLLCGGEPPQALADDYAGAVSHFVIDGDPGWPVHDPTDRHVMAFDLPSTVLADPPHDRVVREVFGSLR